MILRTSNFSIRKTNIMLYNVTHNNIIFIFIFLFVEGTLIIKLVVFQIQKAKKKEMSRRKFEENKFVIQLIYL